MLDQRTAAPLAPPYGCGLVAKHLVHAPLVAAKQGEEDRQERQADGEHDRGRHEDGGLDVCKLGQVQLGQRAMLVGGPGHELLDRAPGLNGPRPPFRRAR